MTLKEVGIIIGQRLCVSPAFCGRWSATFPHDDENRSGYGDTEQEAKKDYARRLSGSSIIVRCHRNDKIGLQLPPKITIG